tara:strand:+ start:622 stop:1572 length:951 start_codon:yes stop_codon:yes gene_type:complete
MTIENLLVVTAEPKSVFLEILFKYLKSRNKRKKIKRITLIGNKELIQKEAKANNYKKKFKEIKKINEAIDDKVNIINIKINKQDKKNYISSYISDSFEKSLKILKKSKNIALLNGPIEKESFFKKKYLGVTEYLAKKTSSKNSVMLIYNKKISVSPITTHLPVKFIAKNISREKIIKNTTSINNFYMNYLKKKPRIAVLGLNPHCETIEKEGEEIKEIIPAINFLKKKKLNINGPYSADTFFIKKNIDKYDVVIGMYHDQVLTPLKTLFNFNAINITIGLPFFRISPDHGPNYEMYGKNKSDPASIFCAMEFLNNI